MRAVLDHVSFIEHASGIQLPDGSKFAINLKKGNNINNLLT